MEADPAQVGQMIELSYIDLLIAGGLVVMVIGLSLWRDLGIHRSVIIATIRCTLQLVAIGYLIGWIFKINDWPVILAYIIAMFLLAIQTAYSRQDTRTRAGSLPGIAISLFIGGFLCLVVVQFLVIGVRPWYDPQYLIPVAGMVLGNGMTAIALCLSHFARALKDNVEEIEQRIALGATKYQAVSRHMREAVKTALMPIINSMMVTGIVWLPGTMTGQVLGGINPVTAVKYQLIIIFMILAGNGLSTTLLMVFAMKKYFTPAHQLRREFL